jgi:hypothetical protein
MLFPDGVYYDTEKHEYLTTRINEFLKLTYSVARKSAERKTGILKKNLKIPVG